MKPRTRISCWLVAGPLLSLSASAVLNSQALGSVSLPASTDRSPVATVSDYWQVDSPGGSSVGSTQAAFAPLSKRRPAPTTSQQCAALRVAGKSGVLTGREPWRDAPVSGLLHAVNGRSNVLSLQAQHVRIQI